MIWDKTLSLPSSFGKAGHSARKDLRAIVAALDALEAAQMAHLRVVSRGLARDLRGQLDFGGSQQAIL
jgi:hypothetical protein